MELTTENIIKTIARYSTLEEFFDNEVIGKEVYDKMYDEFNDAQKGIIDRFDLFRFYEYSKNCAYGHFGDKDVPWERIGW